MIDGETLIYCCIVLYYIPITICSTAIKRCCCLELVVSWFVIAGPLTCVLLSNFVVITCLFQNGFDKERLHWFAHSARFGYHLDSIDKKTEITNFSRLCLFNRMPSNLENTDQLWYGTHLTIGVLLRPLQTIPDSKESVTDVYDCV